MVSVIVPNYNHAAYLQQRFETIVNQCYSDIEIILLDDASTDESDSFLQQAAKHPKVTAYHRNSTNTHNPFLQWQKGISMAKGDYVWIAESDDYSDREFLTQCVEALDAHPDAALACTAIEVIENNTVIRTFTPMATGCYNGRELLPLFAKANLIWNANAVVFRRRDLQNEWLTQATAFSMSGDWWIYSHLLARHKICFIGAPLAQYRRHPQATTNQLTANPRYFTEALTVVRKIGDLLQLNDAQRRRFRYHWAIQIMASSLTEATKREIITKAWGINGYIETKLLWQWQKVKKNRKRN